MDADFRLRTVACFVIHSAEQRFNREKFFADYADFVRGLASTGGKGECVGYERFVSLAGGIKAQRVICEICGSFLFWWRCSIQRVFRSIVLLGRTLSSA